MIQISVISIDWNSEGPKSLQFVCVELYLTLFASQVALIWGKGNGNEGNGWLVYRALLSLQGSLFANLNKIYCFDAKGTTLDRMLAF